MIFSVVDSNVESESDMEYGSNLEPGQRREPERGPSFEIENLLKVKKYRKHPHGHLSLSLGSLCLDLMPVVS